MRLHTVKVHPEKDRLAREDQLAWKFATVATDAVGIEAPVAEMIINRIIDNASVAMASVNRGPVKSARAMAQGHPRAGGAALFGVASDRTVSAEWAALANGTAVRELDYHDTFLAADYSHPADNIPPILAVAQQMGCDGNSLLRGIATGYEIQVNLVRAICLHKHKIDHVAHLGPSAAAGIGTLMGVSAETIYQAVQQALHVTCATRQSRKGEISTWKAFAPAFAGKMAIEAVDRAMRGEGAPSPIYEGEDSVIARMLDGPAAEYSIPLPEVGEPKRAILDTYTKEHSAEYQSQALIDLAFNVGKAMEQRSGGDWDQVDNILLKTSHHTHYVIGTGANDPQKMDPTASRETLDHSIMYILAVALQDQRWHHIDSYLPTRAQRADTVRLWHKIRTVEEAAWTERYHAADPNVKAFGGELTVTFKDGSTMTEAMAVANAHPLGAKPFARADYINKFNILTDGFVPAAEQARFLDLVQHLPELTADEVRQLNMVVPANALVANTAKGLF